MSASIVMSRGTFLRASALAAGTTVLAAHRGITLASTSGASSSAKGSKEITFMDWEVVTGTPFETAINAFQKQTGISVIVQPAPTSDYDTKMTTVLAGGSPPNVMRINDNYVRQFSVANQLMDLTPLIKANGINPKDYFPSIFNFPRQENGTYTAWCLGTQPRVIYYNVDLFKKANVPLPPSTYTRKNWTWGDFLNTAKKLTVPGKQWGTLVIDDTGYEQTFSVNNGDSQGVFSRDGKTFTLASPRGIDAVQWVADLSLKHRVQPPWSQLQPNNANFDDRLFLSGQVAMIFRPLSLTSYYRRNVTGFTWDIAPVPAKVEQKNEGSLIVFMIPKRTPKDKAQTAWQLLEFMAGPEGAKIFAESGGFVPAYKQAAGLIKSGGHQPPAHMELFKAAADQQTTINFTTHDLRARQVYRPQLDLVYTGQKSAKEVLTSVKSQVEAAMVGKF